MLCANAPLLSVQIQLPCRASPRPDPLADSLKNSPAAGGKRASIKVKKQARLATSIAGLTPSVLFGLS